MPSPTSWSSVVPVGLTGSQTIDALLYVARWESSTITYSFPGIGSIWSTSTTTGYGPSNGGKEPWSLSFSPLSTSDQIAFKGALQKWSNVANLQFSQVADTSSNVGDIRAAYTYQNAHANDQSWAYLPANAASAGDIWFNVIGTSAANYWTAGSRSYFAVLHELGHVLGLKHPFEGTNQLPPSLDSESYTIMSYAAQPGDNSTQFSFNPTTPMQLDIAAIQQLYGANYSYQSGNDTYSFSDSATYHETIWDGGGSDTIQYTGSRTATIDLREGFGSKIGTPVYVQNSSGATLYQADNIQIAYGAVIENATGGSGDDVLTGNAGGNVLDGRAGADKMDGGAGIDTARLGGKSSDYFLVTYATSLMVIPGTEAARLLDGVDTLNDIELLSFGGDGSTKPASGVDNQVFGLKYIASYSDLIGVFGTNAEAGVAHYIQNGLHEGRTATFDALKYTASYADLINAFGANATAAETHYIANGYAEGRTATFDALKYTASYADLINAFGTNATAAAAHYIGNGYAEGRTATFDALKYTASYGDLINAFGTNATAAETHYITNGYA